MVGHTLADCKIFLKLRKPREGVGVLLLVQLGGNIKGGMGSAEGSSIEPTLFSLMLKSCELFVY